MNNGESRPWGRFDVISHGEGFQVKLITINANSRLSLQRHKHRSEHWFIVEGFPTIQIGDVIFVARPNQHLVIPAGEIHRISAGGDTVKFIEVQTGTYFGEDDIERLEDDYGRDK